jgi:hypothetical protein
MATSSKFSIGFAGVTPGVLGKVLPSEIAASLIRHESGDWGDVPREDALANERALLEGERIVSAYESSCGVRFWVITEADRSSTTVLLPEEY